MADVTALLIVVFVLATVTASVIGVLILTFDVPALSLICGAFADVSPSAMLPLLSVQPPVEKLIWLALIAAPIVIAEPVVLNVASEAGPFVASQGVGVDVPELNVQFVLVVSQVLLEPPFQV